jgi:hypothetical protein
MIVTSRNSVEKLLWRYFQYNFLDLVINYSISATSENTISEVNLFHNGIIVNVTSYSSQNVSGSISREVNETEGYFFIEAIQSDGNRAWSSPIWVTYVPDTVLPIINILSPQI